jgi:sulfofructose kinase
MSSPAAKRFDVLGLGCAAVDDMLYVPTFPAADKKLRVGQRLRRYGGLTGAALVTAARNGARCAYAGCLGTDEYSAVVARNFASEGVDISHAPCLAEARVVHSTIIVGRDNGSRNIFYEDEGLIGAHDSLPAEELIRESKVLFIDHLGMRGNLRAVRVARAAGVAVVADFENETDALFPEVLGLVDHLILSEEFALRITRAPNAGQAALALWQAERAAVVVTCGAAGCWSVSAELEPHPCHHPAFLVRAADTTGCGDVFHGAYAASLAGGDPFEGRIRYAAAAAALKAGRGEIPHRAAVMEFLRTAPHPSAKAEGCANHRTVPPLTHS